MNDDFGVTVDSTNHVTAALPWGIAQNLGPTYLRVQNVSEKIATQLVVLVTSGTLLYSPGPPAVLSIDMMAQAAATLRQLEDRAAELWLQYVAFRNLYMYDRASEAKKRLDQVQAEIRELGD